MVRICRTVFWLYVIACAASLLLVALSATGALGFEPDPLSGIFAVVLAQPWLGLTSWLSSGAHPVVSLIHVTLCVVLNAAIIHYVCRWIRRI
jgi:hypothetical protein